MSKRQLKFECDARTHRILDKRKDTPCHICARREGSFYGDCSPSGLSAYGVHGSGKYVYRYKVRAFRSWKNNKRMKKQFDAL